MRLIAPPDKNRILGDVPGADFNPQRDPLFNPVPAARAPDVAIINFHHDFAMVIIFFSQTLRQSFSISHHIFPVFGFSDDRHQDNMGRCDSGRQNEPVIVTVGHDQAPDQACRSTP